MRAVNGVSIPVSLDIKNLRETVNQIQGALKGVKVDSSAYSKLSKELEKAKNSLLVMETQTSKPFSSQGQFNQTEKEIGKVEDALQRMKIQLKSVNFKDLKLTDAEAQPFKEIEKQITALQTKMKSFSAEQLKSLKGTSVEDLFKAKKGRGLENEQFSNVFSFIRQEAEKAQTAVSQTKGEIEGLQRSQKTNRATAGIIENSKKEKANVSSIFGADVASQFFNTNGAYKNGARQAFIDYLQQTYTLDNQTIEDIKKKTAPQMVKFLATLSPDEYNNKADKANSAIGAKNEKLQQQKSTNDIAQNAYQQVAAAQQQITDKEAVAKTETESLNAELTKLSQTYLANRNAAIDNSEAFNAFTAQTQQMKYTLESCNAELIKNQRTMNTFNSIKMAITNFMGFTQVLNLFKRAVNEAATHIKKLDSVMTEIAVVTDFTQSDLWRQIDTYSSMAQSYGVAIEGVYEVSALYYQMGLSTDEVMARNVETLKMAKIASLDYATAADYKSYVA